MALEYENKMATSSAPDALLGKENGIWKVRVNGIVKEFGSRDEAEAALKGEDEDAEV